MSHPDEWVADQAPPGLELTEMIVIGSGINAERTASELAAIVKAKHFYKPAHQVIWAAVERLLADAHPIDPASVMEELRRVGDLTRMGAGPYLHSCLRYMNPASAGYHAEKVLNDWRRRELYYAAHRVLQNTGSMTFDADTGFDFARDEIDKALSLLEAGTVSDLDALAWEVLADLEAGEEPDGLTTGIRDLDAVLGRIRPGQFIIVAARPAVGKSVIGQGWAVHTALTLRRPVHFHTLEMSREEMTLRILAAEARVNLSRLQAKHVEDRHWQRLAETRGRLSGSQLKFFDHPSTGLAEIRAELTAAKRHNPPALVVVDYIQLMSTPNGRDSREQQVSALSRGLKVMAKEFKVPIVALCQVNRFAEHRAGGRPALADLRESGSLEQDADIVILLYREDMHDKDSTRPGEMDLIIAKHRNGPTGVVPVVFQGKYARVMDLARNYPMTVEMGRAS